jgi:hypothetical protein
MIGKTIHESTPSWPVPPRAELFHLDEDFSETDDLVALWWEQAEQHKVLPLDDRFRTRFVENANRFHGARTRYVFHAGMGHVPTEVEPDVRSRNYSIEALAQVDGISEGVLIAHGDATTGNSFYVRDGRLVHDMNIGGEHVVVTSDRVVAAGERRLGVRVRRLSREAAPDMATGPGMSEFTLLIDDEAVGRIESRLGFANFISWSGLDIGRDRGSPVSHYEAPFTFTGKLVKVTVTMDDDQVLDADGVARTQIACD